MNERSCRTCKHHKAYKAGIYTDEETGEETVLYDDRCTITNRHITVADFSCGLWRGKE